MATFDKKVKVLFLNHNPQNYGTYYRCFYLAKNLTENNYPYDITLVCANKQNYRWKTEIIHFNESFRIITFPKTGFHKYYTGHIRRGMQASFLILTNRFDIIHSFAVAQPSTAIPTLFSKIFFNIPIIIDWDDAWGDGFAQYHNPMVGKALQFLEKNIPKWTKACRMTVVSEYLRNRAIEYEFPEKKIIKLPNGANINDIKPIDKKEARIQLGFEVDKPIIAAVGHTYFKSLEILLEAFANVIKKLPAAKLVLVGKLNLESDIMHARAKEIYKSIQKNVILAGEQPLNQVAIYLSAADILALPMENTIVEEARFPIRLGDYLAAGRPIVSNAVGEVKYVINQEKCGITVSPEDIDGFAVKITELLSTPRLLEELGRNGREAAEKKYSWNNLASKLAQIYKEILNERSFS